MNDIIMYMSHIDRHRNVSNGCINCFMLIRCRVSLLVLLNTVYFVCVS